MRLFCLCEFGEGDKRKKNLITWKIITNNCIQANKTIFMLIKKLFKRVYCKLCDNVQITLSHVLIHLYVFF